jgi:hypothetical protein
MGFERDVDPPRVIEFDTGTVRVFSERGRLKVILLITPAGPPHHRRMKALQLFWT